ncbi:MAG: SUMF1/EgtB/PvdO family nonheme iron enzyme [Verrucomicrobia bacterium]|nr:SUMF1/EgtB/PvdO family nonheme iron enzyme [Verrucomicrobiota bacterium]
MKTPRRFLTLLAALALVAPAHAQLTVGNVRAAQCPGTKLVDVDFDIAGIATPVSVSLEISADGGTSWEVPAASVTGSVGNTVTPGSDLRITWNAGTDWSEQYSTQMRFKVTATDVPLGFSLIPGGAFTMGDSLDGISDAPTRAVTLSAFFMGQQEVTKAEWDAVKAWAVSHGYTDLSVGADKAADHPVETVTWWDVIKWCNARSEQEGLTPCYTASGDVMKTGTTDPTVNWTTNGYRLPTEAEWEKAAGGGLSGKRFPWGDTISHSQANFSNTGNESYQTGTTGFHPTWGTGATPYTSPVGSFAPNGYGLYDMAGNAWEWCWDWYGTYAPGAQTDPRGAASGLKRVVRGGGWGYSVAGNCRVANRNSNEPDYTDNARGFRAARSSVLTGGSIALTTNVVVETRNTVPLSTPAQHGTVTGAGNYTPGSTATLTATPDPGYVFSKWTGDATGRANPLSVVMDSDKTITAVFGPDPRDPDGDGLTNYQEIVVYGTNPDVADTDGDGFLDGYEVQTGHSPLDPLDAPPLVAEARTAIEFTFSSVVGKTYRIEDSPDLSTWTTVETGIAGSGTVIQRFYSTRNVPKRYFRVEEDAP